MQLFGTTYTANVVKDSTPTYGVFALVLGLLAWVFLVSLGVVMGIDLNVVRSKRIFPRALLTPFTDDVDLTPADREGVRQSGAGATPQGLRGRGGDVSRTAGSSTRTPGRRRGRGRSFR